MAELYDVTDVRETSRFTAGGKEVKYIDVFIRTEHGALGSVRIPAAEYDKETLQETLEDKAQELEMGFEL